MPARRLSLIHDRETTGLHRHKGANGESPGSQPWEHRPKQISSLQRGERSQVKIRVVHRRPHRFDVTPRTARPDERRRCRPEQRIGPLGRELNDRPRCETDTQSKRTIEVLQSVKVVGALISNVLAELPELGRLNRGEVAKLVGVAPINRDSGKKSGKRFIGGGRGQVRRVLYMSTIVAIRHNPAIKAFYAHLKSKGKESKVAIVACMRKFITILYILIKTNQPWENKMSV